MIADQAKNAAIGALVALLIAAAVSAGVLYLRLGWAQRSADLDQQALQLCVRKRDDLEARVATQNAAIEALRAEADAHAERLAAAERAADRARRDADARVRAILDEEVPDECEAAMQWGAEKAVELSERWKM